MIWGAEAQKDLIVTYAPLPLAYKTRKSNLIKPQNPKKNFTKTPNLFITTNKTILFPTQNAYCNPPSPKSKKVQKFHEFANKKSFKHFFLYANKKNSPPKDGTRTPPPPPKEKINLMV